MDFFESIKYLAQTILGNIIKHDLVSAEWLNQIHRFYREQSVIVTEVYKFWFIFHLTWKYINESHFLDLTLFDLTSFDLRLPGKLVFLFSVF